MLNGLPSQWSFVRNSMQFLRGVKKRQIPSTESTYLTKAGFVDEIYLCTLLLVNQKRLRPDTK